MYKQKFIKKGKTKEKYLFPLVVFALYVLSSTKKYEKNEKQRVKPKKNLFYIVVFAFYNCFQQNYN